MITIITICYAGCVIVAFRVVKLAVSPRNIAAAVVIGVFMIGGIVIGWKICAPLTEQTVLRRHVLQVMPDVREFVSKVHISKDQEVKKGDPLFDIAPARFQDAVDQATAQLSAANSTVSQLEAGVKAAEAAVQKSIADTKVAKANVDTALKIQKTQAGAIAKLKVAETQQAYRAAQADDRVAGATLKQQQYSLDGARYSVGVSKSALNTANFNLEKCTYRSPVDGQVVNWQITEQTPVARWKFTSSGTVMDISDTAILAVFPQNQLMYVKAGNSVELAFKRRPGTVVTGKVDLVAKYTGEGQFAPSSKLPSAASVGSKGFLVARIRLDDEALAKKLPLGAAAVATIYTDHGKPFHMISKIVIRMKGWMYFLPF